MLTGNPIHAALSDIGRVRSRNEDAFAIGSEAGVYVLCDGMGGAAAGEIASQIATETFLDFLANPRSPSGSRRVLLPSTPSNNPQHNPQTRIHAAILAANRAILAYAAADPDLHGMGTTLVALYRPPVTFRERRSFPRPTSRNPRSAPASLFLANVGDSRCYRLRQGAFDQLSEDHSFVAEQLRAGEITAEVAAASPMRSFLTRALGAGPHVEPDILSYRPEPGDLYLLASDGLSRDLADSAIAAILAGLVPARRPTPRHLEIACHALIDQANRHGGHDNTTVLLVAFPAP